MHCPWWDDAFVSSSYVHYVLIGLCISYYCGICCECEYFNFAVSSRDTLCVHTMTLEMYALLIIHWIPQTVVSVIVKTVSFYFRSAIISHWKWTDIHHPLSFAAFIISCRCHIKLVCCGHFDINFLHFIHYMLNCFLSVIRLCVQHLSEHYRS